MQSVISDTSTPKCRICYDSSHGRELGLLIRPCNCRGSMALVHYDCLLKWIGYRLEKTRCDLCHSQFEVIRHGFKSLARMTWPHPLTDDWEGWLHFFCLFLWLVDFTTDLRILLYYGLEGLKLYYIEEYGNGLMLYIGVGISLINFVFYGSILMLVVDQWLYENSLFVLSDKNSPRERQRIVERIHRSRAEESQEN